MSDPYEEGKNIVLLRNAQGLTQEELAFRSNRSVHCLQSIERRFNNPTVDTIIHVSRALNVDPGVLGIFTWKDDAILSEIRGGPLLPRRDGGVLQICDNIPALRKALGLSQNELAHTAGVSITRLRDIEHGCANTTRNRLRTIAQAFGLSLAQLHFLATPEDQLMDQVYRAREMAGMKRRF